MAFPHSDSEQCHENHSLDPPPNSNHRPQNPVDVIGINARNPTRYVPLQHLYSATFPNKNDPNSTTPPTKKAKQQPRVVNFYSRRVKKLNRDDDDEEEETELSDRLIKSEPRELDDDDDVGDGGRGGVGVSTKRRTVKRRSAAEKVNFSNGLKEIKRGKKRKRSEVENVKKVFSGSAHVKRWVRLSFDDVDPNIFIGLPCKVYWPLDDDWYCGSVIGYQSDSNRHNVKYEDDDEEELILSNEKIKFHISLEDMQRLSLKLDAKSNDYGKLDYDELVVLAASLDDYQELEPGEIIWAKLSGHAMWPAIIMDEAHVVNCKGLNQDPVGRSVPVQFFGTHDFARIKTKQITPFLRGLLLSCHLKCKKPQFMRSLEEAKMYLSEQKISNRMLRLQNGIEVNDSGSESGEDEDTDSDEEGMQGVSKWRTKEGTKILPLVIGELEVTRLGKIVKDSDYFKDEKFIYPEGYKAVRKFTSITDQNLRSSYKMEVLRDEESKMQPIFRVTADNGKQFVGSTPSACWSKIYKKIRRMRNNTPDGSGGENGDLGKSGSYMFGFSNPQVFRLIKELASPKISSKFSTCKFTSKRCRNFPVGYRPVRIEWKDLDKCNVCHMDEEYENNLFLQCDKCRMMVHARCYGELEPVNGVLWLCNLCRPGAPISPPPCCLCPVVGGAMKPTTDGRWAHLACAIWIPETCLSDVKLMEPIDGLSRINKDRWKLLCSICGVSYGACIQCSNNSCRVAYHPLCARAAGLCLELEDEDRVHFVSMEEDEENQCIRLFSFCKKHKQPSNCRSAAQDQIRKVAAQCSNYTPPSNPTGCARTEPYNYLERRGRKEPEALTASSSKRLFLENQPYLVSGYSQHESLNMSSTNALAGSKTLQLGTPESILYVSEKYSYMRETFRKRLAFGKSRIHGFGIFAKHPHKAGDMMIEYTGELVRPSIADRREHFIYNSLVGAGTYMFRIDDERVIDATRAGSIAHLINHSCEPNCYSRVIRVNDDEHIIIFAKRDIKQWEELTYDYRFFSKDERLACYCGFPRCRGVVNDIDAEGRVAKLYVPRSELIDWRGE